MTDTPHSNVSAVGVRENRGTVVFLGVILLVVVLCVAISLCFGYFRYYYEHEEYFSKGYSELNPGAFLFGLLDLTVGLESLVALIVGIICLLLAMRREAGIIMVVCGVAYMGGCGLRPLFYADPHQDVAEYVEQRLTPLIQAIEKYHKENGGYPSGLDVLVPKYLAELPTIRVGSRTNIYYHVGGNTGPYLGNPWVLKVPVGQFLSFDELCYFPLQNDPKTHPYERLGKWTWCHD